jgi:hypoxanthine phosphoribosyltransferase
MDKPTKYEAPSWDYIYELCIQLADNIRKSGFKPDLLVGICRGGWVPARLLSDFLENYNVASVKVEFYLGIYQTKTKPTIVQPISADVKGKKVLLVDDVADSGESLKLVKDYLLAQGAEDVKICTIYFKPWSIVVPDFYVRETDAWICFPHEIYEAMKKLYASMKGEGKSDEEIEKEFIKIGLKPLLVKKFLSDIIRDEEKKG